MRSETFLLKLDEIIRSGEAVEVPRGSNRGPLVDAMLKRAGVAAPNPWCASFIYHGAMETGLYKKADLPYPAASVYKWSQFFKKKGLVHQDPSKAKRGDIGFWLDENNKGHIFAINQIWKVPATGIYFIKSSEGNTDEGGSREGWKACKKVRKVSKSFQFISFREY